MAEAARDALTTVAVYRRSLGVGLERLWENVLDWEHLPWLHAGSFRSIECEGAGDFGWRAQVVVRDGAHLGIELLVEDEQRYVTRTRTGRGAGSEIWTRVTPAGADRTDIEVTFQLPGVVPKQADALGAGYTALYTRLWDEDEAMMRHRARMLAEQRDPETNAAAQEPLDLGSLAELRTRLPLTVELAGRPVRVVDDGGTLRAFAATCPHWLGPLDQRPCDDGVVTCPWHGYRFDVRSGRSADGRRFRLPPAPVVSVDADERVRLTPA